MVRELAALGLSSDLIASPGSRHLAYSPAGSTARNIASRPRRDSQEPQPKALTPSLVACPAQQVEHAAQTSSPPSLSYSSPASVRQAPPTEASRSLAVPRRVRIPRAARPLPSAHPIRTRTVALNAAASARLPPLVEVGPCSAACPAPLLAARTRCESPHQNRPRASPRCSSAKAHRESPRGPHEQFGARTGFDAHRKNPPPASPTGSPQTDPKPPYEPPSSYCLLSRDVAFRALMMRITSPASSA